MLIWLMFFFGATAAAADVPASVRPGLELDFERAGLSWGSPIFLRAFKDTKELEVWVQKGARYKHFRTYPICYFSGRLGPKQKQGDLQAPEGAYAIGHGSLNPNSAFHLSMNVGYPNAYDRTHGFTGDLIMIHGGCASVGCLAITDSKVEEVYSLVEAHLQNRSDPVPVHIFPFRMHRLNMWRYQRFEAFSFWRQLRPGYALFENHRIPPAFKVQDGKYVWSKEIVGVRSAHHQPTAERL